MGLTPSLPPTQHFSWFDPGVFFKPPVPQGSANFDAVPPVAAPLEEIEEKSLSSPYGSVDLSVESAEDPDLHFASAKKLKNNSQDEKALENTQALLRQMRLNAESLTKENETLHRTLQKQYAYTLQLETKIAQQQAELRKLKNHSQGAK